MTVESWSYDADDPLSEYPPEICEDVREALLEILSGRRKLVKVLGRREAHEWLSRFAEEIRPPRRRKTGHDLKYNIALWLADERAPRGQKTKAIRDVAKRFRRDPDSAIRQLRRLKRRGLRDELGVFPMDAVEPPKDDK